MTDDRYRVFCAYGPQYEEPGCGFEATVESKHRARQLATEHERGETHAAEYERIKDTGDER